MSDEHGFESGARSFHMTPQEFRRWGHATVDWVARYMEQVEQHR